MKTKFAIVVSKYNKMITDKLLEGTYQRLIELGIAEKDITVTKVPGAGEIPLTAKLFAKSNQYKAIICLGSVIRGDTDHYDYVCKQVSEGCQRVMLDFDVPVIFYVLMTHNEEQALDRVGGIEGHKGIEAAEAALEMVKVIEELHRRD